MGGWDRYPYMITSEILRGEIWKCLFLIVQNIPVMAPNALSQEIPIKASRELTSLSPIRLYISSDGGGTNAKVNHRNLR